MSSEARPPLDGAPDPGQSPERQPQAWLHARVRLAPNLLSQSDPWVRSAFDHSWAPMRAMARQVKCLPPALLDYLLSCEAGYVSIYNGPSRYTPGPQTIRHQRVHNVAFVSVADLAGGNERPLHAVGHLIDHHLGCKGDAEGLWLSEGGGATARWQQAGSRLSRLFDLGYAVDDIAGNDVKEYFAQSLSLYCRERQRLNVADPQICRWFRSTLWDAGFWSPREPET